MYICLSNIHRNTGLPVGSVLALFILRHVSSIRNMAIVIIARDAKTTPTVPPTPSPAAANVGSAIAESEKLKLCMYAILKKSQ